MTPEPTLADESLGGASSERVVGASNGKRTLVARDAQHEYVFAEQ
jgi:hypothetical protein